MLRINIHSKLEVYYYLGLGSDPYSFDRCYVSGIVQRYARWNINVGEYSCTAARLDRSALSTHLGGQQAQHRTSKTQRTLIDDLHFHRRYSESYLTRIVYCRSKRETVCHSSKPFLHPEHLTIGAAFCSEDVRNVHCRQNNESICHSPEPLPLIEHPTTATVFLSEDRRVRGIDGAHVSLCPTCDSPSPSLSFGASA